MSDERVVIERPAAEVRTLRQWRRARRWSQAALARHSGHSVSTISTIERGAHLRPEPMTVRDLCAALGVGKSQVREFRDAIDSDPIRED